MGVVDMRQSYRLREQRILLATGRRLFEGSTQLLTVLALA
jgi:hypothetical protein